MPAPFFAAVEAALIQYDIALEDCGRRKEVATLLDECHARLVQVEYLLNRVRSVVEERFRITEQPIKIQRMLDDFARATGQARIAASSVKEAWSKEELTRRADLAFEAELFTETFYWVAFRLCQVIRPLPGLEKFDAEGIRNARNHLVEHPELNLKCTPVRDIRFSRTQGVALRRTKPDGEELAPLEISQF